MPGRIANELPAFSDNRMSVEPPGPGWNWIEVESVPLRRSKRAPSATRILSAVNESACEGSSRSNSARFSAASTKTMSREPLSMTRLNPDSDPPLDSVVKNGAFTSAAELAMRESVVRYSVSCATKSSEPSGAYTFESCSIRSAVTVRVPPSARGAEDELRVVSVNSILPAAPATSMVKSVSVVG